MSLADYLPLALKPKLSRQPLWSKGKATWNLTWESMTLIQDSAFFTKYLSSYSRTEYIQHTTIDHLTSIFKEPLSLKPTCFNTYACLFLHIHVCGHTNYFYAAKVKGTGKTETPICFSPRQFSMYGYDCFSKFNTLFIVEFEFVKLWFLWVALFNWNSDIICDQREHFLEYSTFAKWVREWWHLESDNESQ